MRITVELLTKLYACQEQRVLFERLYPDGAEMSVEGLLQAHTAGLHIWWLYDALPRLHQYTFDRLQPASTA